MNRLRKLTAAVTLALLMGFPAFAGQTETPPCVQPLPGQTETPPCLPAANADTNTTTASSTAFAASELITEAVVDVLGSMIPIF